MIENRKYIIQFVIILVGLIYLVKLFHIQVMDTNYKLAAEHNIIQRVDEFPFRGLIYDRNQKLIVYNNPVFDLMVVPREVKPLDTANFCRLFNITHEDFLKKYKEAKDYSYVKPSVFMKQLSDRDFAAAQDYFVDFPGFYIQPRIVRSYPFPIMANALGYIGETSKREIERDTTRYYKKRDDIGKSGLELSYEKYLRGRRGVQFKMVNVRGIEKGRFKNGAYDTLSIPGENLYSTIDIDLQTYAETLLKGKAGSIVALEPSSGEVLAMATGPSYDPNLLTGRAYSENYMKLQQDSLKPLFNRPLMGMFPPGSIWKLAQALVALQEGVITKETRIPCNRILLACHGPHSNEDLRGAIQHSCNPYFRSVYQKIINQDKAKDPFIDTQIGFDVWRNHILSFGFGKPLGIDLPSEKGGYIPTIAFYNRWYGERGWRFSTIYSNSIGQGELQVVPLQMANLAAIIANKGYYYKPHLIKSIGEDGLPLPEYQEKQYTSVDSKHFDVVIDAMEDVVRAGTGSYRAKLKDIVVCGKTGTVQNSQGEDHSVFIAFAPKENPQIAVSVYVEHGGQGARAAAAIAGLLIEKYIKGCTERNEMESYVLKGIFN